MARNVYVVEADGLPARLIEASQSTQALAYAARTTYAVRKASQHDLIKLLGQGVKVEQSVAEPGLFDSEPEVKVEQSVAEPGLFDSEPEVKVDPAGNVVALAA